MIAEQLTGSIEPVGVVSASDQWMPRGFEDVKEAQLHNAPRLLPVDTRGQTLESWWLAHASPSSVTPSWDIASTCSIDGKKGLLLVEAKAHHAELKSVDRCGAGSTRNFERIGGAISEANQALNRILTGWNLSHENHYQLCNRIAWGWKLASLGTPVVLVYLGFLNATEMPDPLSDRHDWESALRNYARRVVPEEVWGRELTINGVPMYPQIRTLDIPLHEMSGNRR